MIVSPSAKGTPALAAGFDLGTRFSDSTTVL
jgi:hypothetical protein